MVILAWLTVFSGAYIIYPWYRAVPPAGVSTVAIIVWLVSWFVLARAWATKTVALAKVNVAAFILLVVGLLLTFPPVIDLLQGK